MELPTDFWSERSQRLLSLFDKPANLALIPRLIHRVNERADERSDTATLNSWRSFLIAPDSPKYDRKRRNALITGGSDLSGNITAQSDPIGC